ncbi:hypothetical protein FA13DRAFT_507992 [Coprinellus micaceus]|uniref:Uncharacterized protein n=1 Tax=Coprinellus micaceus TaxID=71717 RepID=A0A4Y7SBF5_COPMI|nr:hypothetical protein FA13DRAFT_507992 [Coprinellus micaceus]
MLIMWRTPVSREATMVLLALPLLRKPHPGHLTFMDHRLRTKDLVPFFSPSPMPHTLATEGPRHRILAACPGRGRLSWRRSRRGWKMRRSSILWRGLVKKEGQEQRVKPRIHSFPHIYDTYSQRRSQRPRTVSMCSGSVDPSGAENRPLHKPLQRS